MLFQYDPSVSALIIDIGNSLVSLAIYFSIGVIITKWYAGTKEWNDSWSTAIIVNLLWFVISGISLVIMSIVIFSFGISSFYYWLFGIICLIIYLILTAFVVMKLHDKEFVESLIFFFAVIMVIFLIGIFGVFFIAFIIGVILGVVTLLGNLLVVLLGNSLLVLYNI
ncbi:MAG: hypothetical protein ACFFC7_06875 [Candidatus Hermodarchaeota archaeon]